MTLKDIGEIALALVVCVFGARAFIVFICKQAIRVWGERSLEKLRQKNALDLEESRKDHARALEEAKHMLEVATLQHQIRFSNLHERRCRVIAKLYQRLVESELEVKQYLAALGYRWDEKARQQEWEKTRGTIISFLTFAEKYRIYLPKSAWSSLDAVVEVMYRNVVDVHIYGILPEQPTTEDIEARRNVTKQAFEACEKDIPAARQALEDEFRKILGDEIIAPPTTQHA